MHPSPPGPTRDERAAHPSRRRSAASWSASPRKNETWGYMRIQGELKHLGISIGPSTVWSILREERIERRGARTSPGGKS